MQQRRFYHHSKRDDGKCDKKGKKKEKSKDGDVELSFDNAEEAFKSKTFSELLRAYVVYLMLSSKSIVNKREKLFRISQKVFGKRLSNWIMKKTFYGQFVAGETKEEIRPKVLRMNKFGVKSILDYAVEEDIDGDEAKRREMMSSKSEQEEVEEDRKEVEELGGKMVQYKPSELFADRRDRVVSVRNYFYENEAACDRNTEAIVDSILASAELEEPRFVAVKFTALGRPQLLLQLSEVIMRAREFSAQLTGSNGSVISQELTIEDLERKLEVAGVKDVKKFTQDVVKDKDRVIHIFPWSGIINEDVELNESFMIPSLKEGRMVKLITQLSDKEEKMFRNMIGRLNTIICEAEKYGVHVMVDAEQYYFQPAISRITMEMMNRYNKSRQTVFNTYQCYLKGIDHEICSDLEQAKRQDFHFGCKLVRGAYLCHERERAENLGYPSPTFSTFEETEEMLHKVIKEILERISYLKEEGDDHKIMLMIGSNNEDTMKFTICEMDNYGITSEDCVVFFSQLYGMTDFITFPLGQRGYAAYKYVPYGPVHEVIPYLSRRAQENSGVLGKSKKERKMLSREIRRRIRKGQIFYSPDKV